MLSYMMQILTKDIRFNTNRARVKRRLARQSSVTKNKVLNKQQTGSSFSVEGTVTAGHNTSYAVAGEDIVIDAATWVLGNISVGSSVTVSGYMRNGSEMYAKKVIVLK